MRLIRRTRRSQGFAAIVVGVLASGIATTTAALHLAASILFTPLPVTDDTRLVVISKRLATGSSLVPFSYAEMSAWSSASHTLDAIAGVQYDGAWPMPAELGGRVMRVTGTVVSGNFFAALGARPAAGRLLTTEDGAAGAEDVAVIGYSLWRRRFNNDPAIVGHRARLNGRNSQSPC